MTGVGRPGYSPLPFYGRFFARVAEVPSSCWLWLGATAGRGYGVFHFNGRRRYAHQVAYEQNIGAIPAGLEIDHLCRVPRCVNPAHLEAVTHRENVLRSNGVSATAARRSCCIRGHEYTPENTYRSPQTGARTCVTCRAALLLANKDRSNELRRRRRATRRAPQCSWRHGDGTRCKRRTLSQSGLCFSHERENAS